MRASRSPSVSPRSWLWIPVLCLLTGGAVKESVAETHPPAKDSLAEAVAGLKAGTPIQAGPLTVVPLVRDEAPEALSLILPHVDIQTTVAEADRRRPFIRITNDKSLPVLLTAGRVAGTKAGVEVVLARDVIVPAEGSVRAKALPGSFYRGQLTQDEVLTWDANWAPPELRERIVEDPSSYDVKLFLALFRDVVEQDDADRIPTLKELLGSEFARALDVEVTQILHSEHLAGPKVVGFVSGVYGRPTSLHLFATSSLMRQSAAKILGAQGIRAAAWSLRADVMGVRLLHEDDASEAVLEDTQKALARLRTRSRVQLDGAVITVDVPRADGHGVLLGDRLAHLVMHMQDPFERALFSRSFELPAIRTSEPSEDPGPLDRRAERGTATEFEERLRRRRPGR